MSSLKMKPCNTAVANTTQSRIQLIQAIVTQVVVLVDLAMAVVATAVDLAMAVVATAVDLTMKITAVAMLFSLVILWGKSLPIMAQP